MRNHLFMGVAVAALAIPAAASAQQITSGIVGTVTDENGAPLAGSTVTITDTRTGATRTLTTTSGGSFSATGLVTGGPYTITANADGFEGQTVENIVTTLQGNTSLTFALASGAGEIVVTGTRVAVTQLAVGPGTSFGAEVLASAPSFNRDVRDVLRIDPRVSLDRDDGGSGQDRISCLGGNDRGNAFTVDGITQGDVYGLNDTGFSSRSSTPIPYDAVRETQVQFAPFDVDYGQFTGCAINVVTKSGSNKFSGGGFFEYADQGMRGNSVAGLPISRVEPEKRWGASLGGFIIPDKLFFYGAYEHQEASYSQDEGPSGGNFTTSTPGVSVAQFNQVREVLNRVYGIDTGDIVTSRPYTNDRYFGRLDWQITDRHRLEGTYQHLEESTMRADDLATSGTFANTIVGANTFYLSGTKSDYYSGRLYSQWSDAFSTELRYSRSEVQDLQDPVGGGEAQSGNPIPRIVVGIDNTPGAVGSNGSGVAGAVGAGPGFSRSSNDLRTKIDQYRAVANIALGNHKLKIGAELNHASLYNLFVQNGTGTLTFRSIADLEQGILSNGSSTTTNGANAVSGSAIGAYGNYSATGDINDAAAIFSRDIYSVFAQDTWQVSDRLSVVAGVRTDWYDGGRPQLNPTFVTRYGFPNNTGFSNIDPVVLPRVAFTYDMSDFAVFSRGQLRGGVGIFSGGDPLVWFGNAFQNNGFLVSQGDSRAAGCGTGPLDVVTGGTFTGVPTCVQQAGSASAARGLGDAQSINPDIKMPTVVRANIGFQSDLDFASSGFFSGWKLNLDYIYSEYKNPFGLVDLSQTPRIDRGLNGYTIDGRPIYQAIDPTVAGCSAQLVGLNPAPVWTGVTTACFNTSRDDELMLTNTDGYRSHIASFILSKNFRSGVFTEGGSTFFTLGYSFTDAHDRRSMYNSTAGSNYDNLAAFDRQNPEASRGFYSSKHNITLQTTFREQFFSDLSTSLSATFVARSGRPYSLTWSGGGTFADSTSGNDNALVYIPTGVNDPNLAPTSNATAVSNLVNFVNGLDCANKYKGRTIPRNTCENDWYFDLDLSLSQELPGPGRLFGVQDRIRVYAMFDNFLNLLDENWNVQRRRQFAGLQDIATTSGVDSQGRYIVTGYTGGTFDADNQINVSSSVWRIKVGVSYNF
ncbi:TonB-dependent receptor [Sphingomonas sp. ST-64]|uniref:TonB-dependent receptor n=1 Tax=Sphingomonas plantiphila TaxID=3163295 RepID=A0ABW8YNQ3_9SPHN